MKTPNVRDSLNTEGNKQVTDTELAWLAGFMDGEGYLGMTRSDNAGYPKLTPTISIANTNLRAIERILDITDRLGTHMTVNVTEGNDKHKSRSYARTSKLSYIKIILEATLPFLVIKDSQARLLIRFLNRRTDESNNIVRWSKTSDDDFSDYETLRALNKKGPGTPTTTREASTDEDIVCSME